MKCLLTASDRIDIVMEAFRKKEIEDPIIYENTQNYSGLFSLDNRIIPSVDEYLEKIMEEIKDRNIDLVFSTSGYDQHTIVESIIGMNCDKEGIGFIGQNFQCVSICNNKWLTRKFLESNKVLVPKGKRIDSFQELEPYLSNLKVPCIFKSFEGMSGSGHILFNPNSYTKNVEKEISFPGVIEEFIEGIEVGIDIYTFKGQNYVYDPIYKSETSLKNTHSVEKLRIANYPFEQELKNKIRETGLKITSAVNSTGWLNIDMIVSLTGEIYVLDVNPRNGGTTRLNALGSDINPYWLSLELFMKYKRKEVSLESNNNMIFKDIVVEFPIFNRYTTIDNTKDFHIYYPKRKKTYKGILTAKIPKEGPSSSLKEILSKESISVVNKLKELNII